jgi:hypothetical protein
LLTSLPLLINPSLFLLSERRIGVKEKIIQIGMLLSAYDMGFIISVAWKSRGGV